MKRKTIPTFLGLFILIFGLAAGLVLLQREQVFRLGATGDFIPQDVKITNVSDTSFTVSWTTGKAALSFVKWGKSSGNLDQKAEGATKTPAFIHSVKVSLTSPETTYFFKINSGGSEFDNNKAPWQVTTGSILSPPDKINNVSGSVLSATGTPIKGALVYLDIPGASMLSTTTSEIGSWIIPLSSARTQNLSGFASINEASTVLGITVNAGPQGIATAQIYPQSARPAPVIILGETNDFKNAPISKTSDLPKADVPVPEQSEPKEGFNVDGTTPKNTSETVTLESVDPGEVIASTNPEFFGEGPPGEIITITVESEIQTGQVTVPSSGDWKWTPPADLPEGTHKVKVSWKDAGGILRTIERTFIVQAAEGPAFESTPSATTSPTVAPTVSPKATPTPTAEEPTLTPTPTLDPAVTDSGILTPTIALSIMGIGLLVFSIFIFKESSA